MPENVQAASEAVSAGKFLLAVAPVVLGGLLTAVVGNALVQKWQLRGWFAQQRQLGHQAELEELKRLLEELTLAANNRRNAMRRVAGSLSPNSFADTQSLLAEYRQQVSVWNVSLNSFYVRITLYLSYEMTLRLEREVHEKFVAAGKAIEYLLRKSAAGAHATWGELTSLTSELDEIQGLIFNYLRDLSKRVEHRRAELFYGRRLSYRRENLHEFTSFELIKSIFSADIDAFYVVRPA